MEPGKVSGERVTTPRGLVLEWTGEAWLVVVLPRMGGARHLGIMVRT